MALKRWKNKHVVIPTDMRPYPLVEAIKSCDSDLFPNVYVLLQMACNIPFTSHVSVKEVSVSFVILTITCVHMGKSCLSHLALHIHYDMQVDVDEVVDHYVHLHPCRMETH